MQAYDQAEHCEGADQISVGYNRAIVLKNLGRDAEALQILDGLRETAFEAAPELRAYIETSRLDLLLNDDNCDDILSQAHELGESWHGLEDAELARAWVSLAHIFRCCDDDKAAFAAIERALQEDRSCGAALNCRREWNPDAPEAARYFQVRLEGQGTFDDDEINGFFATFMVVAPDSEAAIDLAIEMEAPRWESDLSVDDCEDRGACEVQKLGVYEVEPYYTFPLDENEGDD